MKGCKVSLGGRFVGPSKLKEALMKQCSAAERAEFLRRLLGDEGLNDVLKHGVEQRTWTTDDPVEEDALSPKPLDGSEEPPKGPPDSVDRESLPAPGRAVSAGAAGGFHRDQIHRLEREVRKLKKRVDAVVLRLALGDDWDKEGDDEE